MKTSTVQHFPACARAVCRLVLLVVLTGLIDDFYLSK